jgi:diamine N-acetyltransferase
MTDLTYRVATIADAAAVAAFGERVFRATFGPYAPAADLDTYCAETYGTEIQRGEIADPDRYVLLAHAAGELAGFGQLRAGNRYACVTGAEPIELLRFYVDHRWHGRGVAAHLLAELDAEAAARGARTMYLAVFEHNDRARAFYRKHGFVEVGDTPFPLGATMQLDLVMVRAVAGARRSA